MSKGKTKWLLSGPFLVWSVAFIVIPLFIIVYYGLTTADGAFTLSNIMQMGTPENVKALVYALVLSVISTVICLVMAYPLAMILSNLNFNANGFIVTIFIIPMWMNFLLRTLAWQTLLEKSGVINMLLGALHLPKLAIINTPYAIILGMVYNFLPFMLLPIYNSLIKIDQNVVNAARDLGANGFQTFWRIIFPLSLPGVIILVAGAVINHLTRNENLAYGFCIVAILAVGIVFFFKAESFEGLLPDIMSKLSLFERFTTFVNGAFDLTAVVYYLSVAGLFLFLSVQSMEKRRYN